MSVGAIREPPSLLTVNGAGWIPAFGLEPKFAEQISIGVLPLWRRLHARSCHPNGLGELLPQTPSGSNLSHQVSLPTGAGGIRTPGAFRHNGFQDRRLKPLGHCSLHIITQFFRMSIRTLFTIFLCFQSATVFMLASFHDASYLNYRLNVTV